MDPNDLGPTLLNTDVIETSNRLLGFAHKLAENLLSAGNNPRTIVFSPLSIAGALQLLVLGARGQTHNELSQLFGYQHSASSADIHREYERLIRSVIASNSHLGGPEVDHFVKVANALFIDSGFSLKPDYKSVVQSVYRAETFSVDFRSPAVVQQVNNWVAESTSGKIREILTEPLHADNKMLVASTVYFNAKWKSTFFEDMTKKRPFWLEGKNSEPVQVDMMAIGGKFPFYDAPELDCRMLALPYKDSKSHMFILLPNNSSSVAVRSLHRRLNADIINNMIAKMTVKSAIVFLPKMHLTSTVDLKRELSTLGVRSLFSPLTADLGLIADSGVSHLVHQVAGGNLGPIFNPVYNQQSQQKNYSNEPLRLDDVLIFSRFSEDDNTKMRTKRNTYKAASVDGKSEDPLRMKDFILRKRITKENKLNKKSLRHRRQIDALGVLDSLRSTTSGNPGLFANEIVHKVGQRDQGCG